MKPRHLLLIGSLAAIAVSVVSTGMAFASERYATLPSVQVSPDVSAPWIAQLQGQPARAGAFQQARRQAPRMVAKQTQKTRSNRRQISYRRPAANPAAETRKSRIDPAYLPKVVAYSGKEKPGTIVIDTNRRFLYLVQSNGSARRYGVGVGKQGFGWKGSQRISRKAKWPTWTPPKTMIARERKKGRILPAQMKGGINNPLGARALYLGSTLYRIHGTNQPWTIGKAMSSGCIRMRNEDVKDLYERTPIGTKVVVR
ncbi:lipoprotein-anchoring transpeptidase ErfK/SrfK [Ochrobactrum daejeonense]|uniref:Lipoprotein-anchoring transpeptidase ErfK/SrfK n=1 Tax=Brucella daejeonensis TaxID=659015 RepID=A0A7W9AV89_9HYPH|nr:L,D-transpeptidase [Brucella daejeonensis]MBB5701141.1 lipoprotein-anchoring transpeptidase ErfK/SrfK [Brucella daejeonensis]NKB79707.1 L,D-transpeptidase [Brucella daejeonensis]